jgi:maltooligosyltrehalose trehalohydrolase
MNVPGRTRADVAATGGGTVLHHRRRWGAEPEDDGRWRFSVWAPGASRVAVHLGGRTCPLAAGADGFHRGRAPARAGDSYLLEVDGTHLPDPAARAQADDVHGPSRLVDPRLYRWRAGWGGRPWAEAVIYEMHLGTFTREGTFRAAAERLSELAALGITAIELMPVSQFAGSRGWGYDGVLPSAPHPAYGTPDEMKDFVSAAQAEGIMVLLDVVMNHFGPDGAHLHQIAPEFFDPARQTPWGAAIDFTQAPVRDFFIDTCLCWITEYRLDGLRLDAVHQIIDPTEPHFLVELGERVRDAGFPRPVHLVTEDERNLPALRESGLYAAEWNDDWHHAIHCALTGEAEGYYRSFAVDPIGDLAQAMAAGHVEQGQPREGLEQPRGAPSAHLPTTAFVNANQTHDQVGNRARGERLIALADPAGVAVAHALLLASPFIPMLFMGEEAGERNPFLFFCDHEGQLADATRDGRRAEFADFASHGGEVPDPNARETFEASRLSPQDTPHAEAWLSLTRKLLAYRAEQIVPLLRSGRTAPAEVERTGQRSVAAVWRFGAGTLAIRLNLGAPPDDPAGDEHWDIALGDLAAEPFAFAVRVASS